MDNVGTLYLYLKEKIKHLYILLNKKSYYEMILDIYS